MLNINKIKFLKGQKPDTMGEKEKKCEQKQTEVSMSKREEKLSNFKSFIKGTKKKVEE